MLRTLRVSIPYLLPWWLLIPATAALVYHERIDAEWARAGQHQSERLDQAAVALRGAVNQLDADIRLVRQIAASTYARSSGEDAERQLSDFLDDFLISHPRYAQARFLDTRCRERVRLDQSPPAPPARTPPAQLQDKSERPYCSVPLSLPENHIYMSPLDANIEQGRVELPIRPMLRTAARVVDASGETLGVTVLNLNAQYALDAFADIATGNVFLINDKGQWLYSPDPADAFAFARGDDVRSLPNRDPGLWRAMQQVGHESGQYMTKSGLWHFHVFHPGSDREGVHSPTWYIAALMPASDIEAVRRSLLSSVGLVAASLLLVVSLLAGALATSHLRQTRISADLERANSALTRSLDQLEQSLKDRVRSEKLASLGLLVAGVAHELNTPLGSAMLSCEALQTHLQQFTKAFEAGLRMSDVTGFMDDSREGLALLHHNLQRAATLIRQFKQVSADRANAERQPFDLAEAVNDVLMLMHNELKQPRISLINEIPSGLKLNSYPGPLGQIVQNLVANALKHAFPPTNEGRITLRAEVDGEQLLLTVSDDGTGIAAADREHIWDPFFTTRRTEGGTGLGLHICQHMAEHILGGTLTLGDPPIGTEMRLRIPLEAPLDRNGDDWPTAG